MNFFKLFFASCLGTVVAFVVIIFLSIAMLAGLSTDSQVSIGEKSVLHLNLEAPITELEMEDALAEIIPGTGNQSYGLLQLKEAIQHAETDPNIEGIYLNTSYLMTGTASIQELRNSLIDFKKSGKWVISYSDFYTEGAYYLATAADKVYMYNEGEVEFNGLTSEVLFFKKMFDKLDIKPEIFRVGDFKSAVEPLIREDLSEENKLQLNSMLNSIYGDMLSGISDARNIPVEKLREISDKMLVRSAPDAVTYGLVDSLYYDDEIKDIIRGKLGLEKKATIPFVTYRKYKKSYTSSGSSANEIAVIVADGNIVLGKADQGNVGAETIVQQVRKARNSDRVKAIVLRVNSPGGVFQAGDMMWRELMLATKQKPVIASMGDYAASGGYYIAMVCDTIVAQPTTITGSIGVFGITFDLSKFLDNKIGITSEEVKTGEIGEMLSVAHTMTDVEKSIMQKSVDEIYETFTSKAAAGRGMTQDNIKKIASGRVWTGTQAKGNGLADVIGGFDDAVKIAASKAGVEDYKLRYYPQPRPFIERLMNNWEEDNTRSAIRSELGVYYPMYEEWQKVKTLQGVQARMGVEFKVK
ncbi:MAG: signal peptide peptidase SppA [Cyclobacteriaceae bacterium]|nr:signal peptide peptidase SppA [Cyclobacteriaceae bacterium]